MLPRIGITSSRLDVTNRPHDVLNRAYVEGVLAVGGFPVLFPVLPPELADQALGSVDALLLSGGGDIAPSRYGQEPDDTVDGVDAGRDEWEFALVAAAVRAGTPVLGICRGAQVLNVSAGGSLIQHLPGISEQGHRDSDRFDEAVHPIDIDDDSALARAVGATHIGVNTLHHQAVAEVGIGWKVVARATDGTVEGIEPTTGATMLGVQWHPELLRHQEPHRRLFEWIVEQGRAARERTQRSIETV